MRVKNNKNYKLYLASALFIFITALKLLLPNQTRELRADLQELISRDSQYEQVFETLGRRIFRYPDAPEPSPSADVVTPIGEYRPVTLTELHEKRTAILPESLAAQVTAEEPTEKEPPEPDEPPAAVTAFLAAQEPFSAYEIPASVTYDMPELPFEYASPVAGYTSSGFGYRDHPIANTVKFHYGTDFAAWTGTDILAFADGTVSLYGWDEGYGNYIIIDHGGGWTTLYAHCSVVYVSGGDTVSRGDKIGLVGETGDVTGPHLHFELKCDGKYYNPEFWLA